LNFFTLALSNTTAHRVSCYPSPHGRMGLAWSGASRRVGNIGRKLKRVWTITGMPDGSRYPPRPGGRHTQQRTGGVVWRLEDTQCQDELRLLYTRTGQDAGPLVTVGGLGQEHPSTLKAKSNVRVSTGVVLIAGNEAATNSVGGSKDSYKERVIHSRWAQVGEEDGPQKKAKYRLRHTESSAANMCKRRQVALIAVSPAKARLTHASCLCHLFISLIFAWYVVSSPPSLAQPSFAVTGNRTASGPAPFGR
jgi:hypothetical protein